jgi:hypothetical protein
MPVKPQSRRPRRRTAEEIATQRALWDLRFHLWGRTLALSVATAEAADIVLGLIEGRPPHSVQFLLVAIGRGE